MVTADYKRQKKVLRYSQPRKCWDDSGYTLNQFDKDTVYWLELGLFQCWGEGKEWWKATKE